MRRFSQMAVAAAGLLAALPSTASADFDYGVTAGEITSSSAIVWTRADRSGRVVAHLSADRRFGDADDRRRTLRARGSDDNTVQTRFTRLRPGHVYRYRFTQGRDRSATGRFETAPRASRAQTINFGISGDADAQPAPGQTTPFWNNFEVYGAMATERNDFNINLGDTIYSDTEVGAAQGTTPPPALTTAEKWGKYKQNLALSNLQRVRRATGLYNHWDDHEFINDFSMAENGADVYRSGVEAFRDYSPVRYSSNLGIYRRIRWGRNLELFFLDQRSFRSAKADDQCINPQTGQPDLAPTAPQRHRNAFALLVPSLSEPVSQQCKDTINSPDRTFLGSAQVQRFVRDVQRSTATFKVVVNEMPVQQLYALPYDRWEGYAYEREQLLRTLSTRVANVVLLTTDIHANLIGDVRYRTLEDPGPLDTGMDEFTTGPVATRSFEKQIDDVAGRPGSGDAVENLFLRPAPPDGVGMRCVADDVFSYADVRVTRNSLTVTPKDGSGALVRQENSQPCGPFTVTRASSPPNVTP